MIKKDKHTYIGTVRELFDPEIEVGKFSQIANGVTFIGGGQHPSVLHDGLVANYPFKEKWNVDYPATGSKGKIFIGNDVWIGENVTILGGVEIGDGAIIGAGAVVASDIPPYAVAYGNPCQKGRYRFEFNQIVKLLEIQWWNWDDVKIKNALPEMQDIASFILKYEV